MPLLSPAVYLSPVFYPSSRNTTCPRDRCTYDVVNEVLTACHQCCQRRTIPEGGDAECHKTSLSSPAIISYVPIDSASFLVRCDASQGNSGGSSVDLDRLGDWGMGACPFWRERTERRFSPLRREYGGAALSLLLEEESLLELLSGWTRSILRGAGRVWRRPTASRRASPFHRLADAQRCRSSLNEDILTASVGRLLKLNMFLSVAVPGSGRCTRVEGDELVEPPAFWPQIPFLRDEGEDWLTIDIRKIQNGSIDHRAAMGGYGRL
ncbi:hypothetical protein K438DRAFT_1767806 [Mycena galopus ATCC 62051]|nr:hypothetical protein K438DRAFT_1767806 [Mycena galopus ATCC 62051]